MSAGASALILLWATASRQQACSEGGCGLHPPARPTHLKMLLATDDPDWWSRVYTKRRPLCWTGLPSFLPSFHSSSPTPTLPSDTFCSSMALETSSSSAASSCHRTPQPKMVSQRVPGPPRRGTRGPTTGSKRGGEGVGGGWTGGRGPSSSRRRTQSTVLEYRAITYIHRLYHRLNGADRVGWMGSPPPPASQPLLSTNIQTAEG